MQALRKHSMTLVVVLALALTLLLGYLLFMGGDTLWSTGNVKTGPTLITVGFAFTAMLFIDCILLTNWVKNRRSRRPTADPDPRQPA